MKKKIFISISMFILILFSTNTKDNISVSSIKYKEGNNTPTEQEALNALKATAYAYYYRGKNIQYSDETYFPENYLLRPTGQSFYTPPEYATDQNTLNLHCMSFVYLVYNQAFKNKNNGSGYWLGGLNAKNTTTLSVMSRMADSESSNPSPHGQEITVFYQKFTNRGDASKCVSCLFRKTGNDCPDTCSVSNEQNIDLKPGDIIVERTGKYDSDDKFTGEASGHAMLYLGDDKVINVSQTVNGYKADKYTFLDKTDTTNWDTQKISTVNPKGIVGFLSLENNVIKFTSGQINKYVFASDIYIIAVLWPFNIITKNNSEYTISDAAKIRVNYPDLVINKTASVKKYDNVYLGEKITYTIKLENKSTTTNYSNISVSDKVPTNTDFVSIKNGNNNNGNLSWTLNLGKGETKEINYTVRVKNDESIINSSVNSNNTKVNGMNVNNIENKIKGKFTKKVYDKIIEISNDKVGQTVENSNIVSTIYKELTNNKYTEFDNKTADNYLNSLYNISNVNLQDVDLVGTRFGSGTKNTYVLKEKLDSMYVKDLFGGIFTKGIIDSDNEDQRYFRINNDTLTIGDVLIIHDEDYQVDKYVVGEKNMYLYIGNGEFVTIDPNTKKVVKLDEKTTETLTVYENGTTITDIHQTNRSRLIESLAGQNTFIVLRPSNIMSKSLIDELNNKYNSVEVPNTLSKRGIILYIISGILLMVGSSVIISAKRKKTI